MRMQTVLKAVKEAGRRGKAVFLGVGSFFASRAFKVLFGGFSVLSWASKKQSGTFVTPGLFFLCSFVAR